ncbi:DUF6719 family protein [Nitrobacter winogradskyi]|uniref:Uncharacterized protein n=2 Tax=Nitrobacter winogradskyi TaxID=913 RepID=A0ACC6AHR3_NITWI|nr:DUF6719 family protein [Nitrobacter winogradskyi]MCP1998410.1 hypothetical protein [Nitrobacter winogradskyi]GEC16221.1 hypothetical protein NWI01_21130 [Nitrobacter winogradskyi]
MLEYRGLISLIVGALIVVAPAAYASQVSRETDIVHLRLGERILVDDGSCPAGEIKEIAGTKLTPAGVVRARKCISRIRLKR